MHLKKRMREGIGIEKGRQKTGDKGGGKEVRHKERGKR